MKTLEFSTTKNNPSFKCLQNFLNERNKQDFSVRIPLLDDYGKMKGYCIRKYDKWGHLIEETYFDRNSKYLLKVLITNDVTGYPLRKDYFNSRGQRIPNHELKSQAC